MYNCVSTSTVIFVNFCLYSNLELLSHVANCSLCTGLNDDIVGIIDYRTKKFGPYMEVPLDSTCTSEQHFII